MHVAILGAFVGLSIVYTPLHAVWPNLLRPSNPPGRCQPLLFFIAETMAPLHVFLHDTPVL